MKTLFTLALLLSSANAFAMQADVLAKTLNDEIVQETLKAKRIETIRSAPSARCMGCFAVRFDTVDAAGTQSVYEAHGMDFGGRFRVSISKME
jgi:hypothetical protein